MFAVRCDRFGSPSELTVQHLPKPSLKPDEVLVEICAAAVNPSDVKNVMGVMAHTTLPRTPGRDWAGIVVAGSERLIGREVWGTGGDIGFTRDGSHSSHIVLPKDAVRPKPRNLSMQQAGSIGVTYVTAWLCLMETARLIAGETVLVIGATGGVGSAAIQIAKWKGAKVLATVRRESDSSAVRQLGADVAINLERSQLREEVFAATEGRGANIIVDTVGGVMVETCLGLLAPQGRLTEISAPAKERRICFDAIDFYRQQARLLGVDSRALSAIQCAPILDELTPGFETNQLFASDAIENYRLADAVKAYERVRDRATSHKVIFTPKEE
jgi:NADPH:quinone reductase